MGSSGIRFGDYGAVPVERSGPGAESPPALDSFGDASTRLPQALADNLRRCRYSTPTPIQRHAIPLGLAGNDLMCVAQTGSGKTCGFLVPVMAKLLVDGQAAARQERFMPDTPAAPRCVVMAPTRELACQIHLEAQRLSFLSALSIAVVYGGTPAREQLAALALGVDMVVATPGRLQDFCDRGVVSLRRSGVLVLDEADRMLDMGFEPQIRKLVMGKDMPRRESRQTLMFSATFAPEVQKLAADFLRQYTYVVVGRVGATVSAITQRLVLCAQNDKRLKLGLLHEALAAAPPPARTLIFVQKKRTAAWVARELSKAKLPAESIHGDRTQQQREAALAAFKSGRSPCLVATDVCARGIDVSGVAHVINFDLPTAPDDFDSYVHRIGRTGRAGHEGLATSFFVPGYDPKHGNGRIAPPLLKLLTEAKQEVPDWLRGMAGPGGGMGGKQQRQARDARTNAGQARRYVEQAQSTAAQIAPVAPPGFNQAQTAAAAAIAGPPKRGGGNATGGGGASNGTGGEGGGQKRRRRGRGGKGGRGGGGGGGGGGN